MYPMSLNLTPMLPVVVAISLALLLDIHLHVNNRARDILHAVVW